MRSLRKTLVLGTTLATAMIFTAAGTLLYLLVEASLSRQFDQAMLDKASLLSSAVEWEHDKLSLEFNDLDMHELEGDYPAGFLELWRADGSILYKSPGVGEKNLDKPAHQKTTPCWRDVLLPDGRPGRRLSMSFVPRRENEETDDGDDEHSDADKPISRSDKTVCLVFTRDTAPMDEALDHLRWLLVLVGFVSIAVSTSVLWWLVRHSMVPLERLAREISRIDANGLSTAVGPQTCPTEIRPVVDRLNDLLVRLDGAFCRERAFSANVAHELRNPLAALCLKMDVTRSKARETIQYETTIDECRQIIDQMQCMVENLLSLARLEAGQIEIHPQPVSLDRLIHEAWEPLNTKAVERELNVQWSIDQPKTLVSDPSMLSLIVRNILENAVTYTDQGGTVQITTSPTGETVCLTVQNTGSRLSQDQAECVFEQFWRGDQARSDAGAHCGLGLSLVKKAVAVLGGTVSVRSRVGGDFIISVSLLNHTNQSEQ